MKIVKILNKQYYILNYNFNMLIQGLTLIEQYLKCYQSLTNPKLTKQANRRLIEIESSPQAWNIASALITSLDNNHQIHGCQLLSKKLNNPLPPQIVPNTIADFVYSQPNKSKLHWLCIGKCLLHMNSKSPIGLEFLSSDKQRLQLLRQMTSAIIQTHTKQLIDIKNLLVQYYKSNKELLRNSFDVYPLQVIDVLNSFLQNGVRLDSVPLFTKILCQQFQDIQILLEAVLKYESYPSLLNETLQYLKRIESEPQAYSIHIAFYRTSWRLLSIKQFQYMVSYVLNNLGSGQQHFAESYQFWQDLMNEHQQGKLHPQQLTIFQNAIVALWRLIGLKCLLTELPSRKKVQQSSLTIDLDEPEENHPQETLDCNSSAQHFRDLAGDFLTICLKTFGLNSPFIVHLNTNLQTLANSTLLQLQLAIYIISTICEVLPQASKQSRCAVAAILGREGDLNQYLCGKVIDLIAKLTNLFQQSPNLMSPCLAFLSKCLRYESLAPLASQSCCELLEETASQSISADLESFLGYLYEIFFTEMAGERTRNNLSKAMAIFMCKFSKNPSQYSEYLANYSLQIKQMNIKTRASFIDSAISAQFWMNVHDDGKHRAAFQVFLIQQAPFFLQNIQASQNKNELTQAVNLLNLALKTNAICNHTDTWVYVVNETINRFIQAETPLPIVLTPLINLAKAVLHLQSRQIAEKVVELLQFWSSRVIVLLGDINTPKIQFNVSNMVVQVHLVLLQLYSAHASLRQRQKYSGTQLLIFIFSLFNKAQIWQYELFKNCIAYLTLAIKLGSPPQQILIIVFKNYSKFADTLWKPVESLLLESFQQSGSGGILAALEYIKSPLNASNPLTAVLIDSFHKGQAKTIKNILLSLT